VTRQHQQAVQVQLCSNKLITAALNMSSVFGEKTDGGPPPHSLPFSVGANVVYAVGMLLLCSLYALVMLRQLKHEAVQHFSTEWQSRDSGC